MNKFSGSVKVAVKKGMIARIKRGSFDARTHLGKEFVIDGEPRDLCGTEVVALNNVDGSRFCAGYDLSMLEITDTDT